MRRITLLLVPVLTLAACQDQLPTVAHTGDSAVTGLAADVEYDLKVNLAEATTLTLFVPSELRVPLPSTALLNQDNGVSTGLMHTFTEGCETHYQDVDGDEVVDLILHFSVPALFGDYDVTALPEETVSLTLTVYFADSEPYVASYEALLVSNEPHRWQGKPNGG